MRLYFIIAGLDNFVPSVLVEPHFTIEKLFERIENRLQNLDTPHKFNAAYSLTYGRDAGLHLRDPDLIALQRGDSVVMAQYLTRAARLERGKTVGEYFSEPVACGMFSFAVTWTAESHAQMQRLFQLAAIEAGEYRRVISSSLNQSRPSASVSAAPETNKNRPEPPTPTQEPPWRHHHHRRFRRSLTLPPASASAGASRRCGRISTCCRRPSRGRTRARCCGAVLRCAQPDRDLAPHLAACARVDAATRAQAQRAIECASALLKTKQQKTQQHAGGETGHASQRETASPPVAASAAAPIVRETRPQPTPAVIPDEPQARVASVPTTPVRAQPPREVHVSVLSPTVLSEPAPVMAGTVAFHALVARAVDSGALPFAIAEHPAFLDLIKAIRPDLSVPSRRELADLLRECGEADRREQRARYR